MLDEILKNAKIKEFGDVVVGYLQKEDFLKLWDLREKKIAEYIKEGLSKKEAKRVVFRDKIKIINPLPSPVKVMNFGYAPCYSLIKDRKKIIENYLERDFAIWVNKMRKNANLLAAEAESEKEEQKIRDKFEAQIEEGRKYYEKIKAGKVDEVIRTDYLFVKELYKPVIYIKYIENNKIKQKKEYLRKKVINVVYEDDFPIPKKPKRDLKMEKKLKEMKNVFGLYYIK
jgi:hypothetical protein